MKWILGCAVMGFLILPSIGSAQDRFDRSEFRNARFSRMDWSSETFGQLLRRTVGKRPLRVRPENTSIAVADGLRAAPAEAQRKSAVSE